MLEYRTFLFDLLIQGRKEDFLLAKPDQKLWINNAKSTTKKKSFAFQTATFSGGGLTGGTGTGLWNNTANAVSSVKFFTSGANLKTGTFLLYGMS